MARPDDDINPQRVLALHLIWPSPSFYLTSAGWGILTFRSHLGSDPKHTTQPLSRHKRPLLHPSSVAKSSHGSHPSFQQQKFRSRRILPSVEDLECRNTSPLVRPTKGLEGLVEMGAQGLLIECLKPAKTPQHPRKKEIRNDRLLYHLNLCF